MRVREPVEIVCVHGHCAGVGDPCPVCSYFARYEVGCSDPCPECASA